MSYFLYSVLLAVGMLLALPYWIFQMLRHGKYRQGLAERLGKVPSRLRLSTASEVSSTPLIWVHAVSVGEVMAIGGLVDELRRRLPRHRIVISTTTDTGQALARNRFGQENVFCFPMDFAFAIRPYLQALQPRLIVLAETEFWPNFLRLARAGGARVAVVNARISDRSWPNYRRLRWALRRMLANVDLFLAQTEPDAARLREIGAKAERVRVTGNLKFDIQLPASAPIVESLQRAIKQASAGPVLVCGSTVEGEEPLLLKTFENIRVRHPRAVMILAPRHPERFESVAILLRQMSIRFWRRSLWNGEPVSGGILLVEYDRRTGLVVRARGCGFRGRQSSASRRAQHYRTGAARRRGHGGKPIPENFRDIVNLFRSHDALRIVGPAELPLVLMELLANDQERKALGQRAAETMRSQTGASARTAEELQNLLASARTPSSTQPAP